MVYNSISCTTVRELRGLRRIMNTKRQVRGHVSDLPGDNGLRDNTIDIDKAIAEADDKQHGEKPKLGGN